MWIWIRMMISKTPLILILCGGEECIVHSYLCTLSICVIVAVLLLFLIVWNCHMIILSFGLVYTTSHLNQPDLGMIMYVCFWFKAQDVALDPSAAASSWKSSEGQYDGRNRGHTLDITLCASLALIWNSQYRTKLLYNTLASTYGGGCNCTPKLCWH